MHTRKAYLNGECTHREYYAQFVDDSIISEILRRIGKDAILASTDKHFNDIPLERWDTLVHYAITHAASEALRDAGDCLTLAGGVCILKEAARQIKEQSVEGVGEISGEPAQLCRPLPCFKISFTS